MVNREWINEVDPSNSVMMWFTRALNTLMDQCSAVSQSMSKLPIWLIFIAFKLCLLSVTWLDSSVFWFGSKLLPFNKFPEVCGLDLDWHFIFSLSVEEVANLASRRLSVSPSCTSSTSHRNYSFRRGSVWSVRSAVSAEGGWLHFGVFPPRISFIGSLSCWPVKFWHFLLPNIFPSLSHFIMLLPLIILFTPAVTILYFASHVLFGE